jgi:predicted negative regulator of RcsB-dependent stress response
MSHFEDEAQVEQLRRWWRENWMALAGGLALGLAGIFGWEAWRDSRAARAEEASQIYEDLKRSGGEGADAAELGERLMEDFPGTPYAAQAALLLASRAAARNDWDGARARLDWAVRNADDPGMQKLAKLRLARVLWQQERPDEALALLRIDDDDPFAPLYLELTGDIRFAGGDREAARAAYEKALKAGPAQAGREGLQRKLEDLGGAAPAPAAGTS